MTDPWCGVPDTAIPALQLVRDGTTTSAMVGPVPRGALRRSEPLVDLAAVAADERLVEDLRAGCEPPTGDQVARWLADWRADINRPRVLAGRRTAAQRPASGPAPHRPPAVAELHPWRTR